MIIRSVALFTALLCLQGCAWTSLLKRDGAPAPVAVKIARMPLAANGALAILNGSVVPVRNTTRKGADRTDKTLPSPGLNVTPEVTEELNRFLTRDRGTVVSIIAKKAVHHPQLLEVFDAEGVPPVLVNLAGIESRFNPAAVSPAGAKGMWQFMRSTGELYGLRVSKGLDQRTDPLLSTVAAARHLRDLFSSYKDWYLALAAYNAGPGRINQALQKSAKRCFWELSRAGKLSRETERFVPRFIALSLIMNNPEQYGFEAPKMYG
jgi:membrane-bound lytic murein transglycosylase D